MDTERFEQILATEVPVTPSLIEKLISFIDLTTLNSTDTEAKVLELVKKANKGTNGIHPAAVCTYSPFATAVKSELNAAMAVAVVGPSFPSGQLESQAKISGLEAIAHTPADEIDIVLNRGDFFSGNHLEIITEISGMKKAAGEKHLKVILETGDLKSSTNIRLASQIAIEAGADFIKTSTGKTETGATPEAVFCMCEVIREHYEKTQHRVGIKPSGGIRTLADALTYYKIVEAVLGEHWLSPSLFRIGASSLYDHLIDQLK